MYKNILFLIFLTFSVFPLSSQVMLRTEYIGRSDYKDIEDRKTGGRGDAVIFSGSAQIPFSFKPTEDGRIKAWGLSLNSSYTSFGNNKLMNGLSPGEIFNNRMGLLHIRPAWNKWSVITTIGAGIYGAHTNVAKTSFNEVLFDGAIVFVWHLRHNLDVGFGAALNSSFGYPMGFPALYLKWSLSGKYFLDMQLMDGATLTAGMSLTEWLDVSFVTDANGSVALQNIDGKKMMFSHSYITVSLQPEFKLGKYVSVPLRMGLSADRTAFYEERTLQAFIKAFGRDFDPHFRPALYISAGINLSF